MSAGGFYTIIYSNAEGVIANLEDSWTVTDQAANEAWAGHELVFSQEEDSDGEYWFKETGKAVDFTISDILDIDGKTSIGSDNYVVKYYTTDGGKTWSDSTGLVDGTGAAPSEAGHYLVAAWPTEDYIAGVTIPKVQYFEIADVAESTEYSLYETKADGSTDDSTFVYSGTDLLGNLGAPSGAGTVTEFGLLVDGEAVELKVPYGRGASNDSKLSTGDYFLKAVAEPGSDYKAAYNYFLGDESANTGAGSSELDKDASIDDAGTYKLAIAKFTGDPAKETAAEQPVVAYLDLNVLPYDFSKADVVVSDTDATTPVATFEYEGVSVVAEFAAASDGALTGVSQELYFDKDAEDGKDEDTKLDALDQLFEMTVTSFENAPKDSVLHPLTWFGHNGTYGVEIGTIAAVDAKTGVITTENTCNNFAFSGDELTADVRKVSSLIDDIAYTGETTDDGKYAGFDGTSIDKPFVINKEAGQSFDATKFTWTNGAAVKYNGSNATLTITKDGEAVSSIDAAGDYKVVVATAVDGNFNAAGTKTFYFKVINSTATAAVYMTFDGKPVSSGSSLSVPETGDAYAYGVQVKSGSENGGLLVAGQDYKVVITDTDTNKEVTEIKTAGNYRISVKNIGGYDFVETYFDVNVTAKKFAGLELVQPTYGYDENEYDGLLEDDYQNVLTPMEDGYAYTGSAIEPVVAVYVNKTVDGESVKSYTELDESLYDIAYKDSKGYDVEASDLKKAADDYVATVKVDKDAFEAVYGEGATIVANADGVTTGWAFERTFDIVDSVAGFNDVKATEWYADSVVKAKQLGYVEGYGSFYAPLSNMTRADFAIILARVCGYQKPSQDNFPTKFEDVAADDYFAWAVDWAYKTGATTGTSETTFEPHAFLTREQAATFLYRVFGAGQAADPSVLDAYSDTDSLTFGKEAMAWCVEEGIFGVNTTVLNPQGNASRADIAALAVRVAPAKLSE